MNGQDSDVAERLDNLLFDPDLNTRQQSSPLNPDQYLKALWPGLRTQAVEYFLGTGQGDLLLKEVNTDADSLKHLMSVHLDSTLTEIMKGKTIAQIQGFDEGHLEALYTIGESRLHAGEIADAASLFQLLILLDPTIAKHYTAFGACQQMLKKYEYALDLYAIAQTQDMSDPRIPLNAAMCCVYLDRLADALSMVNRALSICQHAMTKVRDQHQSLAEWQRLALKAQQLIKLVGIRKRNTAHAQAASSPVNED